MTERNSQRYPDPREEDIMAGDRRISRPDASLPDWEMPDVAYRPIPIVWFTAAMLTQLGILGTVFVVLVTKHAALTIGISALVSAVIGAWTWERGMRNAPTAWQIATITILLVQFLLISIAAIGRL